MTFLHIVFWFLIIQLIGNIYGTVLVTIIYIFYYRKQLRPIFLIGMILLYIVGTRFHEPQFHSVYQVVEAKDKYVILQAASDKYLLYEENLDVGDKVFVSGNPQLIQTMSQFSSFNFGTYLKSKGVTQEYYSNQIEKIEKGTSYFLSILEKAKSIDAQLYKVLARKSIDDITNYGISIGYFFYFLRRKFQHHKYYLLGIGIFINLFTSSISMNLFLCSLTMELFLPNISKSNRIGLAASFCIGIFPDSIFTLNFLLPLFLQSCSILYKTKKYHRYFIILIMFLIFQGEYDLFQFISYPFIHFLEILIWILAFFCIYISELLLFFRLALNVYSVFSTIHFPIFLAPSCFVICIWLVKLYQILEGNKTLYRMLQIGLYTLLFPHLNPIAYVEYINIGQGDCTLIVSPFQTQVILIDVAGNLNRNNAEEIIIPRLKKLQIERIDTLILTHDDFDHSGSKDFLINNFPVEQIIEKEDERLSIDNFIIVDGLKKQDETNDKSLVVIGKQYNLNYFFGGDSSIVRENSFIDIYKYPVDVLKLSHHGSSTSSSDEFLHQIHPKIAVVSSGIQNRYNHPNSEVVDRVNKNMIYLLNTAVDGSIQIQSFFFLNLLISSQGTFSFIVKW